MFDNISSESGPHVYLIFSCFFLIRYAETPRRADTVSLCTPKPSKLTCVLLSGIEPLVDSPCCQDEDVDDALDTHVCVSSPTHGSGDQDMPTYAGPATPPRDIHNEETDMYASPKMAVPSRLGVGRPYVDPFPARFLSLSLSLSHKHTHPLSLSLCEPLCPPYDERVDTTPPLIITIIIIIYHLLLRPMTRCSNNLLCTQSHTSQVGLELAVE